MNFNFSKKTAYKNQWDKSNPAKNHCAVVALFLYLKFDYLVYKVKVGRSWHYFNKCADKIIDETANQFEKKIDYSNCKRVNETQLQKNIKDRFEIFYKKNKGIKWIT